MIERYKDWVLGKGTQGDWGMVDWAVAIAGLTVALLKKVLDIWVE